MPYNDAFLRLELHPRRCRHVLPMSSPAGPRTRLALIILIVVFLFLLFGGDHGSDFYASNAPVEVLNSTLGVSAEIPICPVVSEPRLRLESMGDADSRAMTVSEDLRREPRGADRQTRCNGAYGRPDGFAVYIHARRAWGDRSRKGSSGGGEEERRVAWQDWQLESAHERPGKVSQTPLLS
jgi:hypothetical protein